MTGTARQIIDSLLHAIDVDGGDVRKWDLQLHREKRTLSQNAYYWALLGKTARKLRMPTTELHNRMLRDVSDLIAEWYGGKPARLLLPDTDETEEKALRSETYHIKPTAQVTTLADGITYRTYVLLKGSHDMTTDEFSALVDRLIEEAKQQDIETLTPRELAIMREREREMEARREKEQHHDEP